jgi:hypothetical protein
MMKSCAVVCGATTRLSTAGFSCICPSCPDARARDRPGLAFNPAASAPPLERSEAATGPFLRRRFPRAGATMSGVYALGLVLIWFAPESKGRLPPE